MIGEHLQKRSVMFQEIVDACQYILQKDPIANDAKSYINDRLSEKSQIDYEIGYFPDDDHLEHLTDLISRTSTLELLSLVYPKYISGGSKPHGHFHNHNLIMPFRDVYGNIIALLGRTLLSSEEQKEQGLQKYKYSFGSNKDLFVFGLDRAKDSIIEKDFVIGVEGQFDAISLRECGIDNVVAFGWANMTRFQFFQLHKYTNNLVLLLDNDDAGISARSKIKKRYSAYANIGAMTPPDGCKDIDEFLRKTVDPARRNLVITSLKNLHTQIQEQ